MPVAGKRVEVALVLQGGGALGAYEWGAIEALFALMDESNVQFGEFGPIPSTRLDPVFKKLAVRLDERDLRRLLAHPLAVGSPQRILLDALPGSQKRSFRNLWHYLDDPDAHGKGPEVLTPVRNAPST